jgi:SAM-dependent methyltransferase
MRTTGLKRKATLTDPIWSVSFLVTRALSKDLVQPCSQLTGRMLDLGCGNRPYRALLPNISAYTAYDVDSSVKPEAVGTASELPFASASFDSVLNTQVIEHVEEPWRVIEEIARVLKPGGKLVLSAPQGWRLHEEPHDFYRFTHYGLTHLLARAGMKVIACKPQGGAWLTIGQNINNHLWHRKLSKGSLAWFINRGLASAASLSINIICLILDRIFYDPGDTCNYVVLAERL